MHLRIRCIRTALFFRGGGLTPTLSSTVDSNNLGIVIAALKACSSTLDLEVGRRIHEHHASDCTSIHVDNTLVSMYSKCGSLVDGRKMFDTMHSHDVVTWTALILGYAMNGMEKIALQLFQRMQTDTNIVPDSRTYIAAIVACSNLVLLEEGITLHSQLVKSGCELDMFVASALVDMYAKCGSMVDARNVFEGMKQRDVVCWTALILGYVENGQAELAIHLFKRMQERHCCAPTARTYVAALVACSSLISKEGKESALEKGKAIHCLARKNACDSDVFLASSLIDMYATCGSVVQAQKVFDHLPKRDVVCWTAMIQGYAETGECQRALDLFSRMQLECSDRDARCFVAALTACAGLAIQNKKVEAVQSTMHLHSEARRACCDQDIFVANTLIDVYAKCGSVLDARKAFDRMSHHDVVSWNAMLLGYAENGESEMALELFACVQCIPERRTYIALLVACSSIGALEGGKVIHGEICGSAYEEDMFTVNSLVGFYGKCSCLHHAMHIFESASTTNLVTWNALLSCFHSQDIDNFIRLFGEMQEGRIAPDSVSFLCVLNACNHAGAVELGWQCLMAMVQRKNNYPEPNIEHYHCVIDMLARGNRLDDAVEMAKNMKHDATTVTWTIVLDACGRWKNLRLAKEAFESLTMLDSHQATAYVLMGNIYGSLGMWEESSKVMTMGTRV